LALANGKQSLDDGLKATTICNEKLIIKYASKIRALNKKYQTKQTKVELNFKNGLCQTNYIQSDKLFKYDIESAIQLRRNMYSSKIKSHIIDSLIYSYNKKQVNDNISNSLDDLEVIPTCLTEFGFKLDESDKLLQYTRSRKQILSRLKSSNSRRSLFKDYELNLFYYSVSIKKILIEFQNEYHMSDEFKRHVKENIKYSKTPLTAASLQKAIDPNTLVNGNTTANIDKVSDLIADVKLPLNLEKINMNSNIDKKQSNNVVNEQIQNSIKENFDCNYMAVIEKMAVSKSFMNKSSTKYSNILLSNSDLSIAKPKLVKTLSFKERSNFSFISGLNFVSFIQGVDSGHVYFSPRLSYTYLIADNNSFFLDVTCRINSHFSKGNYELENPLFRAGILYTVHPKIDFYGGVAFLLYSKASEFKINNVENSLMRGTLDDRLNCFLGASTRIIKISNSMSFNIGFEYYFFPTQYIEPTINYKVSF
jgi:hypothetical protein